MYCVWEKGKTGKYINMAAFNNSRVIKWCFISDFICELYVTKIKKVIYLVKNQTLGCKSAQNWRNMTAYGCLYFSHLLSLSRMIKRTSPHSLSVLMMRWDELHLPVCGFSTNLDWGCFGCFSAGAGDRQQGSAPEAVGLEAGEMHSVLEGHPQCACGQHDLWLHLHPAGYRSDTNQMSNTNGYFPLSGTGQYSTVWFGTELPDLACYLF